ncbi:MAG TPA: DUF4917 family protein [Solirubrobacterales bacterium]
MTEVISFERALEASEEINGNRHLLLGNGFSIACRPEDFSYGNLFEEADLTGLGVDGRELFGLFGTADFERVIEALRRSEEVLRLYGGDPATAERLHADAALVKEALADVLARKHPDAVYSIEDDEYRAARVFLANFDGGIYTVSYDLLLYWTLLQDGEPEIDHDDGFRADPDEPDAEWVVWDGFGNYAQRIHFLHGGLHLFDTGSQLKKITWRRTGIPLVDQIRDALAENVYPRVVTEGTSEEKLARIEHSPYLHRGLKSLKACHGTLFVHGHSLDPNDEHVLRRIEDSRVEALFVSLHGDPDSEDNRRIAERARLMAERRAENEAGRQARYRKQLEVRFYDADSAAVWGTE